MYHIRNSTDFIGHLKEPTQQESDIIFNYQYYEQTDRVDMGSSLSPLVAKLFMENFKDEAVETAEQKHVCFFHYME